MGNGEWGMGNGERGSDYALREALVGRRVPTPPPAEDNALLASQNPDNPVNPVKNNPLAALYARFTEEQHCAEIARLLTPPGMRAEVKVVYQSVENLRICLTSDAGHQTSTMEVQGPKSEVSITPFGDWYFTGDYPTPGGYKVLHKALENYLDKRNDRSY
jgi:amidophosphoribosyltransferase